MDYNKNKQLIRKKKTRKISLYSALTLAIISFFFFVILNSFGIVPQKYFSILIIVAVIFDLPLLLIGLIKTIKLSYKKTQICVCILLSILLLVGSIMMPIYKGKLERMFVEVPDEANLNINVYVLRDSDYENIQQLAGKEFAIQSKLDLEYQDFALKAISREIDNEEIKTVSCDNIYDAAESLYNHEVSAMILNEAYVDILADNQDFSDFNEKCVAIMQIPQKQEINIELESVDLVNQPFIVAITGVDEWSYSYVSASASVRSDVNMVVAVNPLTKKILMITIPRDSYVNFKKISNDAYDKLTHSSLYGLDNWLDCLANIVDNDINYYLRVNFSTLTDVVNAIGGIEVDNPYEFSTRAKVHYDEATGQTTNEYVTFVEGHISLNGEEALAYCRERYSLDNGDMDRNEHQAIVLKGCIDKACSLSTITRLTSIIDSLEGKFTSNISMNDIYGLIKMQLNDMASWQIESYSIIGDNSEHMSYAAGCELSMVDLDDESVKKARNKINEIMN